MGPVGLQLLEQARRIVDFAIEADDIASGVAGHRLVTLRRKVNDREAAEAEGDTGGGVGERAVIAGSAMAQRVGHVRDGFHQRLVGSRTGEIEDAGKAAHGYLQRTVAS